jgi:hypothetical protein
MKKRFRTGILVASTNPLKAILCKRLVIQVRYGSNFKVISDKVLGINNGVIPKFNTK